MNVFEKYVEETKGNGRFDKKYIEMFPSYWNNLCEEIKTNAKKKGIDLNKIILIQEAERK